jgi:hypothetical protein
VADAVDAERLGRGSLYPDMSALREVSARVATSVTRRARDLMVGRLVADSELETRVRRFMWWPEYASEAPGDTTRA